MPEVHIHATRGHSVEQKRLVVKEITDTLSRHFNINPDWVLITFIEASPDSKAQGGKLYIDHGGS